MPQVFRLNTASRRFIPILTTVILAQAISGCIANRKSRGNTAAMGSNFVTGSTSAPGSHLQRTNHWAAKWRKSPSDAGVAINYARSLRATGAHQRAEQVLQQASLTAPNNQAVIAEYGKALSMTGKLKQAMHNLSRAQTLGKPDWRIYSAQGITLDKMKRHTTARKYYKSALNLAPNQASILNNIGLSYALEGNLASAEKYLHRAKKGTGAKPKVQTNLALILGLNGKFNQSAKASKKVLSSEDTSMNIAYMKNMLSQPGAWQTLSGKKAKVPVPKKPRKT